MLTPAILVEGSNNPSSRRRKKHVSINRYVFKLRDSLLFGGINTVTIVNNEAAGPRVFINHDDITTTFKAATNEQPSVATGIKIKSRRDSATEELSPVKISDAELKRRFIPPEGFNIVLEKFLPGYRDMRLYDNSWLQMKKISKIYQYYDAKEQKFIIIVRYKEKSENGNFIDFERLPSWLKAGLRALPPYNMSYFDSNKYRRSKVLVYAGNSPNSIELIYKGFGFLRPSTLDDFQLPFTILYPDFGRSNRVKIFQTSSTDLGPSTFYSYEQDARTPLFTIFEGHPSQSDFSEYLGRFQLPDPKRIPIRSLPMFRHGVQFREPSPESIDLNTIRGQVMEGWCRTLSARQGTAE